MFDKRMDEHKTKKRQDIINELSKHINLIDDPKVKAFIIKKKAEKIKAKEDRITRHNKPLGVRSKMANTKEDIEMEEESEEDVKPVKAVAKVRKSTR